MVDLNAHEVLGVSQGAQTVDPTSPRRGEERADPQRSAVIFGRREDHWLQKHDSLSFLSICQYELCSWLWGGGDLRSNPSYPPIYLQNVNKMLCKQDQENSLWWVNTHTQNTLNLRSIILKTTLEQMSPFMLRCCSDSEERPRVSGWKQGITTAIIYTDCDKSWSNNVQHLSVKMVTTCLSFSQVQNWAWPRAPFVQQNWVHLCNNNKCGSQIAPDTSGT